MSAKVHPVTPDGRYFVVRNRLWRCSNPALPPDTRQELVNVLMAARRAKRVAILNGDETTRGVARKAVESAKQQLGERGPVWWSDGAQDWDRHIVFSTPYATWFTEHVVEDLSLKTQSTTRSGLRV